MEQNPDLHRMIQEMGERAQQAARKMVKLTSKRKNEILLSMAAELELRRDEILAANRKDLELAKAAGLSPAMVDRLTLTDRRFEAMAEGVRAVAALPDPVGKRIGKTVRPNGLVIEKRRVPIGVIAIIYESRPNVTADASVLCLKTSNAVIMRGGKEAFHSNHAIAAALQSGGEKAGLPAGALQLVATTDRDAVRELVQMDDRVDLAIPRGGESLIRAVMQYARVPVLKHYKGVCHIYVDSSADQAQAIKIIDNAKCQRPGTCNALETLLVDAQIANEFLPALGRWAKSAKVELRGCSKTVAAIPGCAAATAADWEKEYLALVLSVKVVNGVGAAIKHINRYGSHHSDSILTSDKRNANRFLKEVDSAAVYVNASTRFTDGGEFGMGAEMGISTDKIHARGPMGLEELTTYKYLVTGNGQIRQ